MKFLPYFLGFLKNLERREVLTVTRSLAGAAEWAAFLRGTAASLRHRGRSCEGRRRWKNERHPAKKNFCISAERSRVQLHAQNLFDMHVLNTSVFLHPEEDFSTRACQHFLNVLFGVPPLRDAGTKRRGFPQLTAWYLLRARDGRRGAESLHSRERHAPSSLSSVSISTSASVSSSTP
jgi:hypothetical protein